MKSHVYSVMLKTVIGAIALSATVAYASLACRVYAPADCNTLQLNESFDGAYTCQATTPPHAVSTGGTVVAPLPTRPWYDHAETGKLYKTYFTVNCTFSSTPSWYLCPSCKVWVWSVVTLTALEDAVSLSGTCPP